MRSKLGFTMVELLIVVAIIGILAAIALPLYSTWVIRSKLSEGILALSQCRQSISEIYQMSGAGTTPGVNGWSCGENQTETIYVSTITTSVDGVVQVELRNIDTQVDGSTIHMVPQINGSPALVADIPSQVTGFVCGAGGSNPVDEVYMPGSCR